MPDLDERLKKAVAERDRLSAEAQRIAGRKEAAEKALEALRSEIKAKKLDPDTLDETREALEAAFKQAVAKLESEVEAARVALEPYMETT